ncbi:putative nucleic acid-binding protein [Helianthus annuus]|nr:putative nucleic acid-binding protein [Helianthus annuus]
MELLFFPFEYIEQDPNFEFIEQDPNDDGKGLKSPIDVIGFVVKSFPFEPKEESKHGKDEKKITFMLQDLQHAQIFVTLWDGYVDQILEFQRINQEEKNVVVVVQFGKYRFWGGSAERSSSLSGLSSSVIKSPSKEYLTDFEFSTIGGLNGISETKSVIILGTIKSFASKESWLYNACKNCNHKVSTKTILNDKQNGSEGFDEDQGSYPCSGLYGYCHTYPFEREVVKLLKVSANQLLDKNIELANEGSFPGERKASLNRKFAFKIAVGSFNIKNESDGYSVSKLTENLLVISVLDKKFDDIQPVDEEPVDVDGHVGYTNASDVVPLKDSFSCTGDEETPISSFNKSMFLTPSADANTSSTVLMEKKLKHNLDSLYDVDAISSQSSSKPRKVVNENEDGVGVSVGLLVPKVEE